MSWTSLAKTMSSLLVCAALLAFAYIEIRRHEIYNILQQLGSNIATKDLIPYGPMICRAEGGGFTNSMSAVTYIYGTRARTDYSDFTARGHSTEHAHTFYLTDGTMYYWSDTNPTGYITSTAKWISLSVEIDEFTNEAYDCEPWWFPDERLVMLPDDVKFVPMPSTPNTH